MKYLPVIGLEVHVELKTKSKMFCGCSTQYFGKAPNSQTCAVCLGMPGGLPVPNKKAIEWCILIGIALNGKIALHSKFDRKNYFYPDLAKGYQISQYDMPFAKNGYLILQNGKKIRIRRVHMEEDTGKLMHEKINGESVSLIDFNRSGVPLVEIVTEPDFENAEEVKEYLQALQQIVRYLEVSDANMERGEMRLEPNISLTVKKGVLPPYKVEVKNINSFKFVEKAINFEIKRQEILLSDGITPPQETRGWNETKNETILQRVKEEANDYRYFPEPDIPPIQLTNEIIEKLTKFIPELPNIKAKRFKSSYDLSSYDIEILTRDKNTADFFDKAVLDGKSFSVTPKQIANYIINKKPDIEKSVPSEIIKTILSSSKSNTIDEQKLTSVIEKVLQENKNAINDYKNGKTNVIMYLLGQVLRLYDEKIDPKLVKENLEKYLNNN